MADFLESEAEESEVSKNLSLWYFGIKITKAQFLTMFGGLLQIDSEDEQPAKKPKRKAAVQSDDEDEDEEGIVDIVNFLLYRISE